jgi:hypothetical protein
MQFSYEILPRPVDLGGGWRLRLLEDGQEVGGGVFPPTDEFDDPQEALRAAYDDADWEARVWLESQPGMSEERYLRQAAVDFALSNLALSGLTPSAEWQHHAKRFINGDTGLDAFVQSLPTRED